MEPQQEIACLHAGYKSIIAEIKQNLFVALCQVHDTSAKEKMMSVYRKIPIFIGPAKKDK